MRDSPLYKLNKLTPPNSEYRRILCGNKRSAPPLWAEKAGAVLGLVFLGLFGLMAYFLREVSR